MMHAHEIAEIAEIQEVARRTLGEASVVPKAQKSEDTSPNQEFEDADDAAVADSAEPLVSLEESSSVEVEAVSTGFEIESAGEVEELMPFAVVRAIQEEEVGEDDEEESKGELEAADLLSQRELALGEEVELVESKEDLERTALEAEIAKPSISESSEQMVDRDDVDRDELAIVDIEVEREANPDEISQVDDAPLAEGVVGAKVELEPQEEESIHDEPRKDEETVPSGEVSEAQEIAELDHRGEYAGEVGDAELAEWKRPEALHKETATEVSAPVELPVEGGVEHPTSPVRIITFREGGTEIGICPYCGRFVRGSDLARHKLKHRVRNVFGFSDGRLRSL